MPCYNIFWYEFIRKNNYDVDSFSIIKMTFLPSPSMRQLIAVPTQDKIDFRAACFCHKMIVDVGFVCSVCLSSA